MGALDIKAKKYLGKKDAFADAFNYLIYDGEPVIDPDSLRDMDTSHIALPYGNNASLPIQKYRDLLRIWDAKTDGKMSSGHFTPRIRALSASGAGEHDICYTWRRDSRKNTLRNAG